MTRGFALCLVLALSSAGCFGGCGASGSDYCDVKCDCDRCSDRDYDDCLDEFEYEADYADRRGCSPEWDDYAACVEDFGRCSGHYGCGNEHDRWKKCVD